MHGGGIRLKDAQVSAVEDRALARLTANNWDFASSNTRFLTHNIHPYPAKFIPQIPNNLIRELSLPRETVADIFCGSGTTLLEALRLGRNAVGIDANPIATLISEVKTTPLVEEDLDELESHRRTCEQVLSDIKLGSVGLFDGKDPFRSRGWRPSQDVCEFWFDPCVVEELAELRALIESVGSAAVRSLCYVSLSAIIVRVSKQDSDTRYVRREKNIKTGDTLRQYLRQFDNVVSTVRELSHAISPGLSCRILKANLLDAPETVPLDLVVTSPPYPNAYSYHLYHRTRLLWMGSDPEEFKRSEIGSHRKYSAKGRNRATPETFRREFSAIFQWLWPRLRLHRYACFVIGNSTIDGEQVDNASLLVNAGSENGFREVARIEREILSTRKAFNPKIGRINKENILILQKVQESE